MGLAILPSDNGYTSRHCDNWSKNKAFDDETKISPTELKNGQIPSEVSKSVTNSSLISGKRSCVPVTNVRISESIVQSKQYK